MTCHIKHRPFFGRLAQTIKMSNVDVNLTETSAIKSGLELFVNGELTYWIDMSILDVDTQNKIINNICKLITSRRMANESDNHYLMHEI